MSPQLKYKIRAFILLTVFSLNTVAGFACSVGLNLGYNTTHHEEKENNAQLPHTHVESHKGKHGHSHSAPVVSGLQLTTESKDCCSSQVNSFALLDKSIPVDNGFLKVPVSVIFSIAHFFILEKGEPELAISRNFGPVRRRHSLYDTNIRIAIQSFQI